VSRGFSIARVLIGDELMCFRTMLRTRASVASSSSTTNRLMLVWSSMVPITRRSLALQNTSGLSSTMARAAPSAMPSSPRDQRACSRNMLPNSSGREAPAVGARNANSDCVWANRKKGRRRKVTTLQCQSVPTGTGGAGARSLGRSPSFRCTLLEHRNIRPVRLTIPCSAATPNGRASVPRPRGGAGAARAVAASAHLRVSSAGVRPLQRLVGRRCRARVHLAHDSRRSRHHLQQGFRG
jgi:hypothetical protein